MAIEIKPESQKSKSNLVNYSLYIGITFLIIMGAAYAFLYLSTQRADKKLDDLENQLDRQITEEDKALEKKISEAQRKVERSGRVIENHKAVSSIFGFLENNTHPQLQFDNLELNVTASKAELRGTTEDFYTLGQQVNLLQEKNLVKDVKVSGAQVETGGKIGFDILLLLKPELFNFPSKF